MKKIYIIIPVVILLAIGSLLVFKKINTLKKPIVTSSSIIDKLENTSPIKYLKSIFKVTFNDQKDAVVFKVEGILNDVKIDHEYRVEISKNRISGTVNKGNNIDDFLYLALIDSIFQNYGYKVNDTEFVYTASPYILEKMGISKTNEDEMKFDFVIDISEKRSIPKDKEYISLDNLKYHKYDKLMDTYDNFNIHEGKIFVFKTTVEKNRVKIFIIENGELTENSYKTVLSLTEILLKDKNYNKFHKQYQSLKNISYSNLDIEVDYQLTKDEKITLFENDKVIKITYLYDEKFTLPDIDFDIK